MQVVVSKQEADLWRILATDQLATSSFCSDSIQTLSPKDLVCLWLDQFLVTILIHWDFFVNQKTRATLCQQISNLDDSRQQAEPEVGLLHAWADLTGALTKRRPHFDSVHLTPTFHV